MTPIYEPTVSPITTNEKLQANAALGFKQKLLQEIMYGLNIYDLSNKELASRLLYDDTLTPYWQNILQVRLNSLMMERTPLSAEKT